MPDSFNPFEVKAGRRNSASDEALMAAMAKALKAYGASHAEHMGKMSDFLKALGFEDSDGDGAVTPDEAAAQADDEAPAMKAIDYATMADLVEEAVLDALEDIAGRDDDDPIAAAAGAVLDDDDEDDEPHVLVYPGYAVLCLGGADWRVPWRLEAGAVVLETPDAWQRVEKEWRPVPGAASISADAVKLLDDGSIVAQAIRFGSPDEPDMSEMRDFFTKSTDFWLARWDRRPMLYHHAMDEGTRDAPVIGEWVKAWMDDEGVWLQGQLDRAHKYHAAIKELARRGLLRISTDSAPHLVRREPAQGGAHHVKTWPILAASLTVSPAEPRLLPAELKADLAALGIAIDSPQATDAADAERPDGAQGDAETARRLALEIDILELETTL